MPRTLGASATYVDCIENSKGATQPTMEVSSNKQVDANEHWFSWFLVAMNPARDHRAQPATIEKNWTTTTQTQVSRENPSEWSE